MIDINHNYPPKTKVRVLSHAWTVGSYHKGANIGTIGVMYGVDEDGHVRVKFNENETGYTYYDPDELEVVDEVGEMLDKWLSEE
jgi:hypothetical protein